MISLMVPYVTTLLYEMQIIAVGPGLLDNDGNRKALDITPGSTVLYSKYAGSEFKGDDGSDYIALKFSDVMAILS